MALTEPWGLASTQEHVMLQRFLSPALAAWMLWSSMALPAGASAQTRALEPEASSTESGACLSEWVPTFGGMPGLVGFGIYDFAVFDDGAGPALYAAGDFEIAGGAEAQNIARWDGTSWSALGSGLGNPAQRVNALAVFDDGSGSALYAGGSFAGFIAKWDGASWSSVGGGMNAPVNSLAAFDDGSGPALYAGGSFSMAGATAAGRIAKWDGASWSALGSGLGGAFSTVTALAEFGGDLFAGGSFASAGGMSADNIARWDGASWSALGSGIAGSIGSVLALEVFDDGGGASLFVGGDFEFAGGMAANNVAEWDGASWSALGAGIGGNVEALETFDDGGGASLFVGGSFLTAGGAAANRVAKWDGASWSTLGSGANGVVRALSSFDAGGGSTLHVGGSFSSAGGLALSLIAGWDGASWLPVGHGINKEVRALAQFDDGGGPALYAGGFFTIASDAEVGFIARWDGASWFDLDGGTNNAVSALAVFDDGGGSALYAGGFFTSAGGMAAGSIARWDGASWSPVGGGLNSSVLSLLVFDDGGGPALYAGGFFTSAGGGAANRVAKWDGASWSALGSGTNGVVRSLAAYDDGSGVALYAGGEYTTAGGMAASNIAKWDGASWSPLGAGITSNAYGLVPAVYAMTSFDEGSGSVLGVGGDFTHAGGVFAPNIARWDGASWSALGAGGLPDRVRALEVFDDGGGGALHAGGFFDPITSPGAPNRIARWDGAAWSTLGGGVDDGVHALRALDEGGVRSLYAGGIFRRAEDSDDSFIARWRGCPDTPELYCTGKTTSASCVPFLSSQGSPSATDPGPFHISSNDHVEGQVGLYLYSFKKSSLSFHGGKLCVKAPFERLSSLIKTADGIGCTSCAGSCRTFKRNFNQLIQSGTDPMLTPGQRANIQVRQRDPANLIPTGFADNLSNGISFVIAP
jgi:hypothetical protein